MLNRVYRLGLIGYPLGHSLSPHIHNAALRAAGLVGGYRLYPIPPGSEDLAEIIKHLRSSELHGLNVTIPHKQTVLPLVDRLTPVARRIGAVNTLYLKDGQLTGDNTDAHGFWADFQRQFEFDPGPHAALVLGAGGSARAVVFALLQAGWQVTLAARRTEQARALLEDLNGTAQVLPLTSEALAGLHVNALINTTPLGMAPNADGSPWPDGLKLSAGAAVYDLVYNPPETCLMRQARSQGLRAAGGLGMLIEQAALAFERWTGVKVARQPLWNAVEESTTEAQRTQRKNKI
jgi:shikimate dehydrogenase